MQNVMHMAASIRNAAVPVAGAILITNSMEDINTVKKKMKVGYMWVLFFLKLIFSACMCDLCM